MIEQDYIEPGIYRDEQGTEVEVQPTLDGKYEVDYGNGIRAGFCAATIRKCYPIAVAAVALTLGAGVAQAAVSKLTAPAAKRLVTAYGHAHHWGGFLGGRWTVMCEHALTGFICRAQATGGGNSEQVDVFRKNGTVVIAPYSPAISTDQSVRMASASVKAAPPTLANRAATALCVLANDQAKLFAFQGAPITPYSLHAARHSIPLGPTRGLPYLYWARSKTSGPYVTFGVAVAAPDGYQFDAIDIIDTSTYATVEVEGTWRGPHGTHGIWTV